MAFSLAIELLIQYNGKNYISITRRLPDLYDVIAMVPHTDALGGNPMHVVWLLVF